jgi:2-C-methyl-D-erythritol 2,4-cyclodiphosphate synthase
MFVGIGYDVHRLKKGRPLVLGGLTLESPFGLDGHSDADVLIHAIMDAMLGAAGLEDIGHLFPPSDPKFKDISSIVLLKEVMKELKRRRLRIMNIDSTLIAEKPKIAPHIPQMKETIAQALNIPLVRIGVKATTNEKIGFIGRGEGIAALAIASLVPATGKN